MDCGVSCCENLEARIYSRMKGGNLDEGYLIEG